MCKIHNIYVKLKNLKKIEKTTYWYAHILKNWLVLSNTKMHNQGLETGIGGLMCILVMLMLVLATMESSIITMITNLFSLVFRFGLPCLAILICASWCVYFFSSLNLAKKQEMEKKELYLGTEWCVWDEWEMTSHIV